MPSFFFVKVMRAILLQKDKYGETNDRLHGRYGLTGKPTITQTSIAGSLGTSFKAGQNVTLSNLRGLNNKLKEAQQAITGSNANIEHISDNIDKTKDAGNEVVQLLSNTLWKKLFDGKITNEVFFGSKYQEDMQNELMAGEPGFPVQNSGSNVDTAPIPRVPYWDPWFSVNSHKTDLLKEQSLLPFITNEGGFRELLLRSAQMNSVVSKLQALTSAFKVLETLLDAFMFFYIMSSKMSMTSFISGRLWRNVQSLVLAAINEILKKLLNFEITELGGKKSGAGSYESEEAPSQFYRQNWAFFCYLDPYVSTIINGIAVMYQTEEAIVAAASAMIILGMILEKFPLTAAAGNALQIAAIKIVDYATLTHYWLSTIQVSVLFCYVAGILTSRYENYKGNQVLTRFMPSIIDKASGNYDHVPYKSHLYTQPGMLAQNDLDQLGGVWDEPFIGKLLSIVSEFNFGFATQWLESAIIPYISDSGYNGNSSEIRVYLPYRDVDISLEDTWGKDKPDLRWSYNLTNYGSTNGGSWAWGSFTPDDDTYESIKANVYNGNIYKIKAFDGHKITKTIVLRCHFKADNKWEYFGWLNLVVLDGNNNMLYLHSERNAIYYLGSYKENSGQLLHAEQAIYNYDYRVGHSKMFTSDRRGRLSYYYMDFADGVRLQCRPVTGKKDNVLDNELINTEYKYNNFIIIDQPPMHGGLGGGVDSYCDF